MNDDRRYTVREIHQRLSGLGMGDKCALAGLYGSSRAYLTAAVFRALSRPMLVVLPSQEAAEAFTKDLEFFLGPGPVQLFPSLEVLPFDVQPTHPDLKASRIEALWRLLEPTPVITVAPASALAHKVMPALELAARVLELKVGAEIALEGLQGRLFEMGYTRVSMVEERGEASTRGGILDVFPPVHSNPLRIEFFGDEVESIREFDISDQRSVRKLDSVTVLPAREAVLGAGGGSGAMDRIIDRAEALGIDRGAWEPVADRVREGEDFPGVETLLPVFFERLDTIFDYLPDSALVVSVEPSAVRSELEAFSGEVEREAEKRAEEGVFFVAPGELYHGPDEVAERLEQRPLVEVEPPGGEGLRISSRSNLDVRQEITLKKGTELLRPLVDRINDWTGEGKRVVVTAHNKGQAMRTVDLLSGYGLAPPVIKGLEVMNSAAEGGGLAVATGELSTGFRLPSEALVVISEEEVFGERVKRRPPPSRKLESFLTQLQDLNEGDCTVHTHHGVGLYRGMKRLSVDGVDSDFLLLEYRGGDKLYLPVFRLDLLSKYHGVEGREPTLDKLGGTGWQRTRARVKKSVEKLAGELLKLYAEREVAEGYAFPGPDRMYREFEASFEYDETPDQARAIEEVISDMESPRPMDRLVCGDVGYGKTEVAMRAAFRAVAAGKQVAVLVPTTVLAQQHYSTFTRRFSPWPVNVEVISRFRSRKDQKEVIEKAKSGRVDILIGTHRLLQGDVGFKDLGLMVIDEEHRFGVASKEKLKRLKKKVDVLTLTATPIPRTLQMAMSNVRELSIISTPPQDRLAVRTEVLRFDTDRIREAVERELRRGGQVFFVHNRIKTIGRVAETLSEVVPGARVAVAHGRMKETELEKKMLGFVEGVYDVLLSTAIIESGLDIPRANTMIINRADMFGLADLYQLRGRVGRSHHRAYAYLITPEPATLTDEARKRMEIIGELSEPGSGFRIASFDLEIRGAGELLGTAQSGRIAEVGFDMYVQLLEEAVSELKGEEVTERSEPEIHLKVSQYIPEDFVPDTRQRLGLYKRLASADTREEVMAITEEMEDRYGELPDLAENLVRTMALKVRLREIGASELAQKGSRLYLTFEDGPAPGVIENALQLVEKDPKRFRVTPDSRFISLMETDFPIDEAGTVMEMLSAPAPVNR